MKNQNTKTERPANKAAAHNRKQTAAKPHKSSATRPADAKARKSSVARAADTKPRRPAGRNNNKRPAKVKDILPLRIIPLGGIGEVGKNMTVFEYGNDMIVVDCGTYFPESTDMPGIDYVIPDITYLQNNLDKAGKDAAWLCQLLHSRGFRSPRQVFLLTLSDNDTVTCIRKENT